jgi:anaerobic ribonucleoside-triphosphate reductase
MTCRFCGIETDGSAGHETQEACIQALESEVSTLKRILTYTGRIENQTRDRAEMARRQDAG